MGALKGVGSVLEIFSEITGGSEERANAEFNALLARKRAKAIRAIGTEKQFELRQDRRKILAKNEALAAKGGVQMTGSPMQAQLQVINTSARDIAITGFNADLMAKGLISQSEGLKELGREAEFTGRLRAGSKLVSSLGELFESKKKSPGKPSIDGGRNFA